MVSLFARTVNHDFVSSVVGYACEVFFTLVTSVQNPGILVNSRLVSLKIVVALQVFVADFANESLLWVDSTIRQTRKQRPTAWVMVVKRPQAASPEGSHPRNSRNYYKSVMITVNSMIRGTVNG
jgi:hypothetical protein